MVEVIAEDEVVAVDGGFGREAEGDAVLVVGFAVFGEGEVGGGGGGGVWEAAVGLGCCSCQYIKIKHTKICRGKMGLREKLECVPVS